VFGLKVFLKAAAFSFFVAAVSIAAAESKAQPNRGTELYNAAGVSGLPRLSASSRDGNTDDPRWNFTLADVLDEALWRQKIASPLAGVRRANRVQLTYAAERRGINRPSSEFLP